MLPLFFLCVKPKVITSDAFPMIFISIFAFTNGYCGTIAMMSAPTKVKPLERETTGILMTFFLIFGLATGSMIAFGLKWVF